MQRERFGTVTSLPEQRLLLLLIDFGNTSPHNANTFPHNITLVIEAAWKDSWPDVE